MKMIVWSQATHIMNHHGMNRGMDRGMDRGMESRLKPSGQTTIICHPLYDNLYSVESLCSNRT
ncbi:hypothetical protein [Endozoicomonas montiporae]|nr:hypothetical protein [Endozoicomonas montiporae]